MNLYDGRQERRTFAVDSFEWKNFHAIVQFLLANDNKAHQKDTPTQVHRYTDTDRSLHPKLETGQHYPVPRATNHQIDAHSVLLTIK